MESCYPKDWNKCFYRMDNTCSSQILTDEKKSCFFSGFSDHSLSNTGVRATDHVSSGDSSTLTLVWRYADISQRFYLKGHVLIFYTIIIIKKTIKWMLFIPVLAFWCTPQSIQMSRWTDLQCVCCLYEWLHVGVSLEATRQWDASWLAERDCDCDSEWNICKHLTLKRLQAFSFNLMTVLCKSFFFCFHQWPVEVPLVLWQWSDVCGCK